LFFVDFCGIVNHHCLKAIVCFVDIWGIVNHHWLEEIVCFVDIGGIANHDYKYQQNKQSPLNSDG
jgi:hypothetical protein